MSFSIRSCLAIFCAFCLVSESYAQREYGFDNTKSTGQPYLKPQESLSRMKVADSFEVKLFAAEPDVINPIAMTVDERGRIWVIECYEYPKRTAKGKMPRDRIKILESTKGDGVCDKVTIFAEGKDFPVPFDLASGIEVGNGGVYVGAPPYLFFIENKNDKPGKFEILLKGFGSQDTHETLNTFQWGPDGWLYGLQGVFTHSDVKPGQADGVATRLNAGIWRYHPTTKKFEIFAEGTSNPWGMDYRNSDGQFILCCCVIPHLFHITEGGSFKRQAGASFNPNVYSYIPEICDHIFHKESGWAHAGLVSLDTPLMPEKYRNSVIFGSIHGSSLKQNILAPNGATFKATRGDDFLVSGDKNFRPINLRWGPNGEIYCIDWHDQNPCHQAAADAWDYERGRIFSIQTKGLKTQVAEDLGKWDLTKLTNELIRADNPYRWRTALRMLYEKRRSSAKPDDKEIDQLVQDLLKKLSEESELPSTKLRMLFGLEALRHGDLLEAVKIPALQHNELLKSWLIRLIGTRSDQNINSDKVQPLTSNLKDPNVRLQLAILARKSHDINLLHQLLETSSDPNQIAENQQLWLAINQELEDPEARRQILSWLQEFSRKASSNSGFLLSQTIRKFASSGKPNDVDEAVKIIENMAMYSSLSPDSANLFKQLLESLIAGLPEKSQYTPSSWSIARQFLIRVENKDVQKLVFKVDLLFLDPEILNKARKIAADNSASEADRLDAIKGLAADQSSSTGMQLNLIVLEKNPIKIRVAAAQALAARRDLEESKLLLNPWSQYPPEVRSELLQLFSSRKPLAKALLQAVEKRKILPTDLNDNLILKMQAFKDKEIDTMITKSWGKIRSTPAELNAVIEKMRGELNSGSGDFAKGRLVFENHCSKCHVFEGKGHQVGPLLEGADRGIEYLLVNVLDPNRVVGAPYYMRTINFQDGKVETGILESEDDKNISLKGENGVIKKFSKADIEEIKVSEKSLMPEGLGYNMTPQDFRNLVRYVMRDPYVGKVSLQLPQHKENESLSVDVPVTGRITLPEAKTKQLVTVRASVDSPAALKTTLLLGVGHDAHVRLNGRATRFVGNKSTMRPDALRWEVELKQGANELTVTFEYEGKQEEVYIRFLDPERKLTK